MRAGSCPGLPLHSLRVEVVLKGSRHAEAPLELHTWHLMETAGRMETWFSGCCRWLLVGNEGCCN